MKKSHDVLMSETNNSAAVAVMTAFGPDSLLRHRVEPHDKVPTRDCRNVIGTSNPCILPLARKEEAMKVFALVPVWLAVMAVTCAGNELPVHAGHRRTGIVQFSYSFSPLPPLPRRFQNHLRLFRWTLCCTPTCAAPIIRSIFAAEWCVGCCHIGHGYCNAGGFLPCGPALFSVQLS